MSKTVAEIIVETLQQAGAKHCYGVVGDSLNFFTDALRRSSIRFIHVRHEEAGAFAAGAEALLTDTLTLCAGSCGPGSLHFINGVFESNRNRAPVVLIASDITLREQGTDFPQEVPFKEIYKMGSVFCEQITSPEDAQRKTAMAAQAALSKRGVAVLIMPMNIASQPAPERDAAPDDGRGRYGVHRSAPVIRPGDGELQRMAGILNNAAKVTIYGGSGCEGAHDEVVALARALQAPVAHTSRGKDFLEYDNPFCVGMLGPMGSIAGAHAVKNCDALLMLGADFAWNFAYPNNADIIQVDVKGEHLGRRHPITLGLVGDSAATAKALLPLITPRTDSQFLDASLKEYTAAQDTFLKNNSTEAPAIHSFHLARLINQYAADDALFTADGGSPMIWILHGIQTNGRRRTLASLLHGTMANAMPQALGLKTAFPERQVIALCGDGGISMLLGDLLTAVQENIPIKVAVFNNSALLFVALEQRAEHLPMSYVDLKNPDFSQLGKVLGFWAKKVEKSQDLDGAVQEWLAADGPALLDVVVQPEMKL